MAAKKLQSVRGSSVWSLAARQHGVVARRQLLAAGLSTKAIKHRVARGRLHRIRRGVYAVGRPELTQDAQWMAAVLACGPGAVLSHGSAAALWKIRAQHEPGIDVTVASGCFRKQTDIRIHRRNLDAEDFDRQLGIPVTSPQQTLVDLGLRLDRHGLEAAVNEADKLNLVDAETLSSSLDRFSGQAGVAALRALLDRPTFTLTDSELERRFLPLARRAGLPRPLTGQRVNGFKVDFYWPDLCLIVETDGLRYHRTPAQQARDRLRDQAHTAAGGTTLRFTHAQVAHEPDRVVATLTAVARRLR